MTGSQITMPRLSDSMEEGTLVIWLKSDGETVAPGDAIAEIESDKATSEYAPEVAGVLRHLVDAGSTVPVGTPIATVGHGGNTPSAAPQDVAASAAGDTPATQRPSSPSAAEVSERLRPLASPVARRLAAGSGVDLASVDGTGPRGRITRQDVLDVLDDINVETPSPAAQVHDAPEIAPARDSGRGRVTEQVLSRPQQLIAKRMSESRATVPDFEVRTRVDAGALTKLRSELKADGAELVPSINDFIVKAAALALREIPRANGTHRGDHWELWERINIGIAVAVEDGLLVPTLFDADRMSVGAIARTSRELANKGREGRLSAAELSGGTFTISNLGMFGTTSFSAVIFAPQVAILTVGAAVETAVVRNGQLVPGVELELGLSCDHRILYGADAARLLGLIRHGLEDPLRLLVG